ncbi:PROTEIN TIC110 CHLOROPLASTIC [Salix purpurea]|uniref:PROTEIN TIC110 CHLOROPLASTIC n=1 Tax=Salix purpurea TaxID=77065 RepID=A0A9Q0VAJ7_SALPP|nr:PROTEIN TIC110 CHLOROPLASTIC [Salix purpurea]
MKVTEKCDVYSFGVVTMEVLMGRHPGDLISTLSSHASSSSSLISPISQQTLLKDVLDQRISFPKNRAAEGVVQIMKIALACLHPNPHSRPAMGNISSELATKWPPLTKPFSTITLEDIFSHTCRTKFGGGSRNLALGGAAVAGVAGGAVVFALNSAVPEVAAINLHNYVSGFDDPTQLSKKEIEGIAKKYGVSKQDEAFNAELCDLYSMFVSSVIPPGGEELTGNEVETIINFKNALGMDDPDAASMHVELGRRIFRQRLETGDRDGDVEQRRAFQKLIYVSTLVFGEASSFLLPWKRVFRVTDSQVEIAIRDNAQRLYFSKLKSVVKDIDVEQLVSLRQAQLSYRLSDELAEDLFRQHTRKLVEKNISAALDRLKSRTRTVQDVVKVVEELDKILAFNNKLISLKNHEDAASFACGVGPVSVSGGKYDSEREKDDLKLLYRAYVTDALSGKREAESITLDITSKVYRKRLAQGVSSGDLEFSDSKAAFLQNLCEELHFDPQKATEIHEEIYRQKLQQCAADGVLSDEDVKALTRLRVMLCIPQHTIDAAHSDICGSLFEKVVSS